MTSDGTHFLFLFIQSNAIVGADYGSLIGLLDIYLFSLAL
jgi:hypothetical protein